jgi:hypothetical protein
MSIAEAIAYGQAEVIVRLAGRAAERRSLEGGRDGWSRFRSFEEIKAYHEAGHAVLLTALRGSTVLYVDILSRPELKRGGLCIAGHAGVDYTPEQLREDRDRKSPSDYKVAVQMCFLLAPSDWRATLRVAKALRAETDRLVDAHWRSISSLANELAKRGAMNREEIEPFLPPRLDQPARAATVAACSATGAPETTTATKAAT